MLTQSCSVPLLLLPAPDGAAVTSTRAALTLRPGSLASPPAGPSICMKYQMTPLTTGFGSHHLDGCKKPTRSILTQQGWRGCVLGRAAGGPLLRFWAWKQGKSLGGGEAWKPREKLHPSTLSSSTSQPSLLPPCKKAPPFTLYLELGQCSEPAGVIISLILCGKEEILALAFAFFLTALSWWVSLLVWSPAPPFKLLCDVTAKVVQDQHLLQRWNVNIYTPCPLGWSNSFFIKKLLKHFSKLPQIGFPPKKLCSFFSPTSFSSQCMALIFCLTCASQKNAHKPSQKGSLGL